MINSSRIDPNAEMLLTSAGPTTEQIQQHLLEMARGITPDSQKLNILRIADGWQPFNRQDNVPMGHKAEHIIGALTSRRWSTHYIGYVLGLPNVATKVLGDLSEDAASELITKSDMILVPGGNTWQTIKGLQPHRELFHSAIIDGKPYVGESAGSIVAGLTTVPAMLPPADTAPQTTTNLTSGLGLVNFDIAVHAAGRVRDFDMSGPMSKIMSMVLKSYETPYEAINGFISEHPLPLETLNDVQAISISKGRLIRL